MHQRNSLPRLCIALGFSDVNSLLDHARREQEAGESFFEFRLDYLPSPEQGVAAIRDFLTAHPECKSVPASRSGAKVPLASRNAE